MSEDGKHSVAVKLPSCSMSDKASYLRSAETTVTESHHVGS
jgi:hypothetical protein